MSERERIEEEAALFIQRRNESDWSSEDAAALKQWLARSLGHRAAFLRLERGWALADRLGALQHVPESPEARAGISTHILALAAALLLTVGISAGFLYTSETNVQQRYDTAIGERGTARLADGSQVELNTDTHVRTRIGGGRRELWLDRGEAYFEIAHDASHPFTVHLGARDVVVLGTRFSIRRDTSRLTVAVAEGVVRLGGAQPDRALAPTVLRRGDLAVAEGSSTLVLSQALDKVEQAMRWRDGIILFDDQPLGDVLREFNRYLPSPLVVTDPAAASLRITGSFRADNADALIRLAHDVYKVNIVHLPKQEKISSDRHTDF